MRSIYILSQNPILESDKKIGKLLQALELETVCASEVESDDLAEARAALADSALVIVAVLDGIDVEADENFFAELEIGLQKERLILIKDPASASVGDLNRFTENKNTQIVDAWNPVGESLSPDFLTQVGKFIGREGLKEWSDLSSAKDDQKLKALDDWLLKYPSDLLWGQGKKRADDLWEQDFKTKRALVREKLPAPAPLLQSPELLKPDSSTAYVFDVLVFSDSNDTESQLKIESELKKLKLSVWEPSQDTKLNLTTYRKAAFGAKAIILIRGTTPQENSILKAIKNHGNTTNKLAIVSFQTSNRTTDPNTHDLSDWSPIVGSNSHISHGWQRLIEKIGSVTKRPRLGIWLSLNAKANEALTRLSARKPNTDLEAIGELVSQIDVWSQTSMSESSFADPLAVEAWERATELDFAFQSELRTRRFSQSQIGPSSKTILGAGGIAGKDNGLGGLPPQLDDDDLGKAITRITKEGERAKVGAYFFWGVFAIVAICFVGVIAFKQGGLVPNGTGDGQTNSVNPLSETPVDTSPTEVVAPKPPLPTTDPAPPEPVLPEPTIEEPTVDEAVSERDQALEKLGGDWGGENYQCSWNPATITVEGATVNVSWGRSAKQVLEFKETSPDGAIAFKQNVDTMKVNGNNLTHGTLKFVRCPKSQ